MFNKFRRASLALAESFDAWRIIPRLLLILYAWLVVDLYLWYTKVPTYVQETCDGTTLKVLIDKKVDFDEAKHISCTVKDVVGGPTPNQTAFVTTIIGLSSVIFGLYTATGRKWDINPPK